MKTQRWLPLLLVAGLGARSETVPGLTVHEWGTFTTFSGSDGFPARWYQPLQDTSPLPSFVHSVPTLGKSVGPSRVRMETPVLYFYPPRAMNIGVKAGMLSGRVSEWFPGGKAVPEKLPYGFKPNLMVDVEGELLPPGDAAALASVPSASGPRGAHYAAARAVPDAWFFRSRPDTGAAPETDHLFFYRGAGDEVPPFQVRSVGGAFFLHHTGSGQGIAAAYALSVRGDQASWKRLPALPERDAAAADPHPGFVHAMLDATRRPVGEVERELAAALTADLIAAGLTSAEARAMVATWQGLWFREHGDRVLALLPRAWVDRVVPLTLTPTPEKLERVFVARFEILVPEREAELATLMGALFRDTPDADARKALTSLALGRFAEGAIDVGVAQHANLLRSRMATLLRPPPAERAAR